MLPLILALLIIAPYLNFTLRDPNHFILAVIWLLAGFLLLFWSIAFVFDLIEDTEVEKE
jgi:hypothetical protein